METIFALSSGQPPAGIAIIRISGPAAGAALQVFADSLPEPRRASYRAVRDGAGVLLDHALVLWFPGPDTATGEDLAELHLHGGRAVVAAVEDALSAHDGLRRAEPGEFTRRAFANGRIDLVEAEGLADLLAAETELQRRSALAMAEGALSQAVAIWRDSVLGLSAQLEAVLDFSDEEDGADLPSDFGTRMTECSVDMGEWLERPRAENLREGFRVVLAGPPNAGKSSLFNCLIENEAAITSPIEGTTRDVIERPVAIAGIPFTFVDTAGLRCEGVGEIEAIGVERAQRELGRADCILWLGPDGEGPDGAWEIEPQIDRESHLAKSAPVARVSAVTGEGIGDLRARLIDHARHALPAPGQAALGARQHRILSEAQQALQQAGGVKDPLLIAEQLRVACNAFDRLVGHSSTEDMLDALFGRFCIGK